MKKNKALLIGSIVWCIAAVIAIVLFVLELFVETAPMLHKAMFAVSALASLCGVITSFVYYIRSKNGE